jgi:hypothetical protein
MDARGVPFYPGECGFAMTPPASPEGGRKTWMAGTRPAMTTEKMEEAGPTMDEGPFWAGRKPT